MKNLKTFMLVAFLIIATCSCAQKTLFPTLNNQPDITKIFISKSMINMGAEYATSFGGANISENAFKKLNFMEVIAAENKKGGAKVSDELKSYINANPTMETLMSVSDDGDIVEIYGIPIPDTNRLSRLLLYTRDSDGEVALIVMDGEIDPADLGIE